MKKSEMMKKNAERAYVMENIIEKVRCELQYDLYEALTDEDGNFVTDEDGNTVYALPVDQRENVTWDFNYLTKAEREAVYLEAISLLENALGKM